MMSKGIFQYAKNEIASLKRTGAIYVVSGSFLTKFVSFFGSIFLVRLLNKSDYGILSYGENLLSYFMLFAGGGLAGGILRYVVIANERNEKRAICSYCLGKGTTISCCVAAIGYAFCVFYPHPAEYVAYKQLFGVSMILVIFIHWITCGQNALRALFINKTYAIMAFTVSTMIISARALGAFINDVEGIIYARIVVECLLGLGCVYVTYLIAFSNTKKTQVCRTIKKQITSYSIQLLVTDGLWTVFMLNDVFLLGQFGSDPSVLADYKIAYVIPGNLTILVSAIGTFIVPYFTKHENVGDYKWIRGNYYKVLVVSIAVVGMAVIVCNIFSVPIIIFLYGEEYLTCIPVMRLLLIMAFINCGFRYASANILTAMGKAKYNMIVSAICVGLQIVINMHVIPVYGAIGVACTSILLYLMMAVALYLIMYKNYLQKSIMERK